jgi:hypothetical protein
MPRFGVRLAMLCACGLLAAAPAALGAASWRSFPITAAPAPDDFSLLEIAFPHAAARQLTRRLLAVSAREPYGDDFIAVASPLGRPARAFVLVVDRPSPLLDPALVRLRGRARRSLGSTRQLHAGDVLAHSASPSSLLCGHASSSLATLRPLGSQGAALPGFGTAAAVAQAYDAACGLPYSSTFAHDVLHGGACGAGASAEGAMCCGPIADCTPTPSPPSPPTPGCPPPCGPQAAVACPLQQALAAVCEADRSRAAGAGAH